MQRKGKIVSRNVSIYLHFRKFSLISLQSVSRKKRNLCEKRIAKNAELQKKMGKGFAKIHYKENKIQLQHIFFHEISLRFWIFHFINFREILWKILWNSNENFRETFCSLHTIFIHWFLNDEEILMTKKVKVAEVFYLVTLNPLNRNICYTVQRESAKQCTRQNS